MLNEPKKICFSSLPKTLRKNECNHRQPLAALYRIVFVCLVFLFASFSCKDSPSASDNVKVTLTFEDASCIETWLRLKIENAAPPYSIALSRDGNTVAALHILSSDTLLIDEGLSPSTTYTYRANLTLDNNIVVRSPDAQARTLDTTSHNWVFEPPVLLGDGSSSVLYDVAIINDTLAYAVGEIYKMDSLGNWDPNAYNLVKWDGSSWELMRIQFYTICGQPSRTPYPAKAIFAFSENDVWIASQGGQVARWDGTTQTATMCMPDPFVVNKLWGENPSSVYAVGNGGGIARYDGTSWRRVESGTTLPIQDIWGAQDRRQQTTILCIASNVFQNQGSQTLSIQGNSVIPISNAGLSWQLWGVWYVPNIRYFAVGAGIHYKRSLDDSLWTRYPPGVVTQFASGGIRGNGINDVFVAGSFGEVVHFNGLTWHRYFSSVPLPSGAYGRVDVRGDLVIAVGLESGSGALALRGTR